MKVILEIKDNKVDFILNLLQQYSFVKAHPAKRTKVQLKDDLKASFLEIKQAKEGKVKLQTLSEFLDEL